MLSPRAIAVQGVGYGPLLTAVQGLLGIAEEVTGVASTPSRRFIVRTRRQDEDEELFLILSIWLQVCGQQP